MMNYKSVSIALFFMGYNLKMLRVNIIEMNEDFYIMFAKAAYCR